MPTACDAKASGVQHWPIFQAGLLLCNKILEEVIQELAYASWQSGYRA